MHTQQRERERFARCPDPSPSEKRGEGEEKDQEQNTESTRRARGLCRPLGRLAHAVAVGLAFYAPDAFPAWTTLASRAGLTMPECRQGMRELRARQLVEVIPPGPGDDGRPTNTYRLSATLTAYLGYEETDARQEERPPQGSSKVRADPEGNRAATAAAAQDAAAEHPDADAVAAATPDPPVGVQVPVVRVLEADLPAAAQPGGPAPAAAGCADGVARAAGRDARGPRPSGLTASIRDILSRVADGAPVEVVTPAPRCPALRPDEDDCASGWHRVTGSRSVRRCGAPQGSQVAARKAAPESVLIAQSQLAAPTRTPEQHRAEAETRRKRAAAEGLYVAAGEVQVGRHRLADLDAITERGRDATGAWTTVVGYLFPTETAADVARRGAT